MNTCRGFTLTELMITIAVFAVITSVALPDYRQYVASQRVRGASFDLMASLVFARSEAIKRNASVAVTQAGGGWTSGWTVSTGTSVLRKQDAYHSGVSITNSASLTTLSYSNDGRLAGATTDFSIAPVGTPASIEPRCVSVRLGGMPSSRLGSC